MKSNNQNIKKNTFLNRNWKIVVIAIVIFILLIVIFNIIIDNQKRIEKEQEEQDLIEQKLRNEEEARINEEIKSYPKPSNQNPELEFDCVFDLPALNLPSKILDIPILYQYPELPSGCEGVALTNYLNYIGFNLDKNYLIDNYFTYSDSDFIYSFCGDPYDFDYGGAIMSPGIKKIANNFLYDNQSQFKCFNVSGHSLDELYTYIEHGHPVQIWSSIDMCDLGNVLALEESYNFYENSHSVLLEGFDRINNTVYISDSISGHCQYDFEIVEEIFNLQNQQAIVIVNQKEIDDWIKGEESNLETL